MNSISKSLLYKQLNNHKLLYPHIENIHKLFVNCYLSDDILSSCINLFDKINDKNKEFVAVNVPKFNYQTSKTQMKQIKNNNNMSLFTVCVYICSKLVMDNSPSINILSNQAGITTQIMKELELAILKKINFDVEIKKTVKHKRKGIWRFCI